MAVFVLDKRGKPLMPCSERRARLLLNRGRARVHRVMPFAIRLTDRTAESCEFQTLRIKIDPGSKTTGMAMVRESEDGTHALNRVHLLHRGHSISESLTARAAFRRGRRNRKIRYRAPRFLNRTKPRGWLAPSMHHRVHTTQSWVNRLIRYAPIEGLAQELVKFDVQQIQNPEISGTQYQQGELVGYEVREYLLEKWHRTCAYCGVQNVPLQVEHIQPKAAGGSDRVSNLTLACPPCNQKKGHQPIAEFLKGKPEILQRIQAHAQAPLKDAAAVNATRWALFESLKATGMPVEVGSGGKTKFNRTRLGIPKDHALDAACVGNVNRLHDWERPTLAIKAMGRGSYQRTRLNAFGFPRGYLMRQKQVHGFQTGDLVKATVLGGKKQGVYRGRVAVRKTGSFNIQTAKGVIEGISHKHCRVIQRGDGYGYLHLNPSSDRPSGGSHSLPGLKAGVSRGKS